MAIFATFPCGNGVDVLNTIITAGGSNGAPIGDVRSDWRQSGERESSRWPRK